MENNKISKICRYSVAGVCVAAAAYLCANGKDGWGWFLLIAILII